jgi:hypothetical protein
MGKDPIVFAMASSDRWLMPEEAEPFEKNGGDWKK